METFFLVPEMKVGGRGKKSKATKLECETQELLLLYDNKEERVILTI